MTFAKFFKTSLKRRFFWLLLLESLALAIFFWDEIAGQRLLVLLLSFVLSGLIILRIFHVYALYLTRRIREDVFELASAIAVASSPFLLLSLAIIPRYMFLNDFRQSLIIFDLAGTVFLHMLFLIRLKRKHPQSILIGRFWSGHFWDRLSTKRLSWFVFFLSFVVYCLWASGLVFPSQPLTGDEPHYLIITKSLLVDGDIDLSNNYQSGDYLDFYPGKLDAHSRPGKSGGQYSRHTPGLPLLLAPAYFLGEKAARLASLLGQGPSFSIKTRIFFARSEICLLASLLGLTFFWLIQNIFKNRRLSLLAWLVFCFTGPMLFYSQLIYPEIPAALITLAIFGQFIQSREDRRLAFFLAGLGIGFLPWLGVKYVVLAAAAFLIVFLSSFAAWRRKLSKIIFFLVPLAVSGLAFLAYFWILYGNLSPISLYRGTSLSRPGMRAHLFHYRAAEFLRCGLGYLLDQRIGIIPYAPIYLIIVAGIIVISKTNKREAWWGLFLFAVYWVFCSSAYYWGGYCPPGRTLLPVLWVLALFMAAALRSPMSGASLLIRNSLVFLSLAVSVVAMLNPWILYHENLSFGLAEKGINSNLLTALSNSFINLRNAVPHLINEERLLRTPLVSWLAITVLVTIMFIKKSKGKSRPASRIKMSKPAALVLNVSILCLLYVFFNVRLEGGYSFEKEGFSLFAQDQNSFPPELGGFWTRGESRATLFLRSRNRVRAIILTLRSPSQSRADIQVGKDKSVVFWNQDKGMEKSAFFLSPVGFSWKGDHLYFIRIKAKKGFFPYREEKGSLDRRYLGAFVKIRVDAQTYYSFFDILGGSALHNAGESMLGWRSPRYKRKNTALGLGRTRRTF
jgi:hypothetical protein